MIFIFKKRLRGLIAYLLHHTSIVKKANLDKLVILTYHRILPDLDSELDSIQPGMYVTESSFKQQMKFISDNFKVINFEELFALNESGNYEKGGQYCIITFDDGWIDNYYYAYPILKKYNIQATMFLPTDFVGTTQMFWPDLLVKILCKVKQNRSLESTFMEIAQKHFDSLKVFRTFFDANIKRQGETLENVMTFIKQIGAKKRSDFLAAVKAGVDFMSDSSHHVITWDMAREMSASGIFFGSHGCSHAIFTECDSVTVRNEMFLSKAKLLAERVNFTPVLCFPNGDFNEQVIDLSSTAGYDACLTTTRGVNRCGNINLRRLNRVAVHDAIACNKYLFSFHLAGILS